jgi:hypothetical protein
MMVVSCLLLAEGLAHVYLTDVLSFSDLSVPAPPPLWYRGAPNARVIFKGFMIPIPPTEIQLNSKGFRSREEDPADHRPNIYVFGDSNTVGVGVKCEETYCALLEEALPGFVVRNYAVEQYNFMQEYTLFKESHGPEALSLFVLPGYYLTRIRPTWKPMRGPVARHSRLYALYFLATRFIRYGETDEMVFRDANFLAALHDLISNYKNVWFVLLPKRAEFDTKRLMDTINGRAVVLNCSDIYADRANRIVHDEELLNPKGHRLVADRIAAAVAKSREAIGATTDAGSARR